jgi:hypothetical protein
MDKSDQVNDLFSSLSKAQSVMKPAVMDKVNPHYRSKYASLDSVMESCKKPLSDNGLAIVQTLEHDERGGYVITTTLGHSSGQWISSSVNLLLDKQNMQGLGSSVSYARRYCLAAMIGVVSDEDVDGEEKKPDNPQNPPVYPQGGDYKIMFGKYNGRRINDISPDDLQNYVGYLRDKASAENKEIRGVVADFINEVEKYLGLSG